MTTTMTHDDSTGAAQNGRPPVRVLVMIGSTRQDRFGPVPAIWAADAAVIVTPVYNRSFPNFWEHFTDDGAPKNPAAKACAATAFYDQLAWWAQALRTARNRSAP